MGKNILIVEDCETTRKLLSFMVREGGHNPIHALNGIDALEKLAQNEIHLVLTDLNMPQMDGLELTKTMRNDANYKNIPVIMVSTEAGENDKKMGYDAGVTVYVTKPISAKWLLYQIEKLV